MGGGLEQLKMSEMQLNWLNIVKRERAIAVIRTHDLELGRQIAYALAAGGMSLIEIAWNQASASVLIEQLSQDLPQCTIGSGTILNREDLKRAIGAGARFLFMPHTEPGLIEATVEQGIPVIPGALSATEILTAWQAGATCVKVFPIQAVGGINYLKALRGPLGHIPLIPTGGVTVENARAFLQAGAIAVGLSTDLCPTNLVQSGNWAAIRERARQLMNQLKQEPPSLEGSISSITGQTVE